MEYIPSYEQETKIENLFDTRAYFDRCSEFAEHIKSDEFLGLAEENQDEYFEEMVVELGELCPLIGEMVFISGVGVFPYDDEDYESFSRSDIELIDPKLDDEEETFTAFVDGLFCTYAGLNIDIKKNKDGNDTCFRLTHRVNIGEHEYSEKHGLVKNSSQFFAKFDLDCSMLLCSELEAAALGIENPEQYHETSFEDLVESSRYFVELLGSTKFRRLSKQVQKRHYEQLMLHLTNKAANIIDSYVVIDFVDEDEGDPYLFNPQSQPDGSIYYEKFLAYDYGIRQLLGCCIGITSVDERAILEKPVRRDSDLIDKKAGICLAIDISHYETDETEAHGQNLLYVPLGKGANVKSLGVVVDFDLD